MIEIVAFVDEGLGHSSYLVDLGDGRALIVDPPRLPEGQLTEARSRDLEIAFTRNSGKDFRIIAPGGLKQTVTTNWDHDHGSPRKYIRVTGPVNGGGHTVKVRTVNGDVEVKEGS